MGCIDVRASRVGDGLHFGTKRIGDGISVQNRRIGDGLHVRTGVVCTIGNDLYLKVSPDVVWVSPDIIRQLLVESNTQWKIE